MALEKMRPRKSQAKTDSPLLNTIRQLSLIQKDEGSVLETHISLRNGWAVAFNGVIAMGEPIKEDLATCPNGLLLKEALSKCGQGFSITQNEHNLLIKSDKFKALVPCLALTELQPAFPDPPCALISDAFKHSLSLVAPLALDEGSVVTASVLIHNGTCISTDRLVLIQAWHGIDLPPMLALPKALIKPLISNPKKLAQFGLSKSSCTFYYEDGSWIKTQFFNEKWPDVGTILDKKASPWPIPENFYTGVKALEKFSETGFVYFDSNVMRSHEEDLKGASYDVYGLPKGPVLNIKQLKMIEPLIKTVDFLVPHCNHKMTLFFGERVRGAIAGRV